MDVVVDFEAYFDPRNEGYKEDCSCRGSFIFDGHLFRGFASTISDYKETRKDFIFLEGFGSDMTMYRLCNGFNPVKYNTDIIGKDTYEGRICHDLEDREFNFGNCLIRVYKSELHYSEVKTIIDELESKLSYSNKYFYDRTMTDIRKINDSIPKLRKKQLKNLYETLSMLTA